MEQSERGFVKMLGLIGKGARLSVIPLALLICGSGVTVAMAVIYAHWAMELSWAWSLVPLWCMLLPLMCLSYYWFSLDGLSKLPETLLQSKEIYALMRTRYAARLEAKPGREIRGIGPIATVRRMLLLGGLLWDSRDAIDAASNLYSVLDLLNPLFWVVMLVSCVSCVVLSLLFVSISGVHYFFF